MKPYYLFDQATGEFTGIYQAQESPREPGVYIAPVNSTDIAPPAAGAQQVAVFANGAWILKPDYRGQMWYDAQGNAVEITTIGTPLATLTATLPAAIALAGAQTAKNIEINAWRDVASMANVSAAVGGTDHVWQADAKSVSLLNGAISLAQSGLPLPTVWRTYDNVDVPISALADLLSIAGAIAVQVQTAYAHSWALKAQVAAAATVAEVEAITW